MDINTITKDIKNSSAPAEVYSSYIREIYSEFDKLIDPFRNNLSYYNQVKMHNLVYGDPESPTDIEVKFHNYACYTNLVKDGKCIHPNCIRVVEEMQKFCNEYKDILGPVASFDVGTINRYKFNLYSNMVYSMNLVTILYDNLLRFRPADPKCIHTYVIRVMLFGEIVNVASIIVRTIFAILDNYIVNKEEAPRYIDMQREIGPISFTEIPNEITTLRGEE